MAPAQTTSTIYRQTIGKIASEIKKNFWNLEGQFSERTIFWKD